MAKYKKKRARELQHDKFRDTAGVIFDRLGNKLEGKGRAILYGLVGVVVLALLVGVLMKWNNRKADEARRALGRAIAIASAPTSSTSTAPSAAGLIFASEQERARRAIEEFQKVAAKYGDPYRTEARYFIATNLLSIDHDKAMSELTDISKSGVVEAATLARFAIAQSQQAEGKYDDAARLYAEVAAQNSTIVSPENANLQLANVYDKQGKKKEAVDLLFNIVDASRKQKDQDGTSIPPSGAAKAAAEKLQKLDPDRYAKLTPEPLGSDQPF